MSFFGAKGMTNEEAKIIVEGLKKMAEAVSDRLCEHDAEIAELRAEINRLKAGPRMTVAQRAKARGYA